MQRNEAPAGNPIGSIGRFILLLLAAWMAAMALILATAFFLGLLGANPEADFSAWIYARTQDIMTPFAGIFDPIEIADGTAIRTSLLFAMFVYAVLASILSTVAGRLR